MPSLAQRGSPVVPSLQECSDNPLFERKDKKDTALLDLDGKANTLTKRYAAITDAGVKIQGMVEVRPGSGHCSQGWVTSCDAPNPAVSPSVTEQGTQTQVRSPGLC